MCDLKLSARVAVLREQQYHSCVAYSELDSTGPIEGVLGYSYLSGDVKSQTRKQSAAKQHDRIIQAYTKIHSLLSPGKDSTILTTGTKGALMERLEPPPGSKSDVVSTTFARVHLECPQGPSVDQFVNCRSSNIKVSDLKESARTRDRSITISTGICLFSSRLLGFIPTKGLSTPTNEQPLIPPLPYARDATLYEIETCTRMATTIAGLAATASTGKSAANTILVRLDVPRLQYYCYPLELFEAGLVDREYVLDWFQLVDKRHHQISALLSDMIHHQVQLRGCSVQIELTSGTIAATQLLRLSVLDRGECPSVEDLIFVLKWIGPHQALWREFLAMIGDSNRPKDVRGLTLLAYVFEVIQPALYLANSQRQKKSDNVGRPVLIQVDDIAEWRIFDRADKFLKYFKERQTELEPLLLGVFPSPQIFTEGSRGRSTLFLHDPGQDILHISCEREKKEQVKPLDIVGKIHGSGVCDTLKQLLIKHGLSS